MNSKHFAQKDSEIVRLFCSICHVGGKSLKFDVDIIIRNLIRNFAQILSSSRPQTCVYHRYFIFLLEIF